MTTDISDLRHAVREDSAGHRPGRDIHSIPEAGKGEPAAAGKRAALAELLSFLIVGGAAALGFIGLSTVMVGYLTTVPGWIVSAGCYAAFIVPVYLAHRYFSFRSGVPHAVALPRYVAVQLGALGLAALFSFVCYAIFAMPTAFAAALVIGLTSGVNFLLLKLWAFARSGPLPGGAGQC